MIADIIKALEQINPNHCKLSTLKYDDLELPTEFYESKYLERPFAYEFYHQFRKLIEHNEIKLKENVLIQGEVDKEYQHIKELSKIPDFLVHIPSNTTANKAVIEFKLANRELSDIKKDFTKLLLFKEILSYNQLIEVLIGKTIDIDNKKTKLQSYLNNHDTNINIVFYDIDKKKAEEYKIKYKEDRITTACT